MRNPSCWYPNADVYVLFGHPDGEMSQYAVVARMGT